ncbi:MAG: site-specific integrase [SAR202 cluster bacterium]|nr:site-specific integrase [SAR202 cluster bacterium]
MNIMVDGVRIHRVIGHASQNTTRTQAEDFIAQARTAAREGRLALPKGRKLHLTFEVAAEEYLKKLKESGGRDYANNEQHLRGHLIPYLGKMRLDSISTFTLEKYRRHLRDKQLAEGTINRTLATYRRMARRLVRWDITDIALPMVTIPREKNRRERVLLRQEIEALEEAARLDFNPHVWLFVRIALHTSLRHAEILGARFGNHSHPARRLRVLTKGGRWREQPLTATLNDLLKAEHEKAYIRTREEDGDDAEPRPGWIFPNPGSKSGHIDSMKSAFRRVVKASGMNPKEVTPHVLRHTAITMLSEAGADVPTIQAFSGHRSLEMVMRYAHARDRQIDSVLDRLDEKQTNAEQINPSDWRRS